jgi:hypothetical protein
MAGSITVSSITLDSDNNFSIKSNTGATILSANGTGLITGIASGSAITNAQLTTPTVSGNLSLDSTGTSGVRLPAANTITFHTAGTEDVRIDSAGNMGIGTTSPTAKLEVIGSSEAATSIFRVGANGNGGIIWRSANNTSVGYIQVNSDNVEYRSTNDSAGAYLQKSGITFPATQSASADANTLDDYEEGTWTPSLGGNTTYTTRAGFYRKIGSLVFINAYILINARGTGSASVISGLPFNPNAGASENECVFSLSKADNLSVSVTSIFLRNNGTDIYSSYRTASSSTNSVNQAYIQNGTELNFSGCYIIF